MSQWHCYLKIAYYLALIGYHISDIVFDWIEFGSEVCDQGKFAGVPTNSTAVKRILGLSCGVGSLCSLAMVVVYLYYIDFHWKCSQNSGYCLINNARLTRDGLLNCSDDNQTRAPVCNRHFVLVELVISNFELYLKDDIQSVLLIYMYGVSQKDPSSVIQLDWRGILFAVCSIVANLKLCVCFTTKLFGLGSGEKMPECESTKHCCCLFGMIGSIIFEILSILYLALALSDLLTS
ncbi:Hypothetical predicted protein [Paramuricea clavata]|uniref:Uncharacterized protein n=1 Tax=Paramuricea clavata TaxID=317549 RepID=A0A6S7KQJ3_PARCT|nr:Hypothetical predicted protein [Paramuricea clavata]